MYIFMQQLYHLLSDFNDISQEELNQGKTGLN
jgi:hypothetical protein